MIPPTRATDERRCASSPSRCAGPAERLADLRAQRAANLTGARRVAELVERLRRASGCARGWPRSSTTRSAARGRRSSGCRTASYEAERRARGRPPTAAGRRAARARATIAGDALRLDFDGQRRAGRRQPQLPALGDQVGGLLRRPRARPTPTPRRRAGAHRPVEVLAPPGLRCSTPGRRRRSPPATSRRRAGSPTSCWRRSAGATDVPAQGQGTMNNLTLAG